jgi:Fe-S cluster biogenesis protein NfuA
VRFASPVQGRSSYETNVVSVTVLESVEQSVLARVEAALDEVRPAIARDGGDVWLVRVEAGIAYVQMVGACGGCSMVETTLKGAIERVVLERCSDVTQVVAL